MMPISWLGTGIWLGNGVGVLVSGSRHTQKDKQVEARAMHGMLCLKCMSYKP